MSKVCDAADFFSPEYIAVVKELKAVPALHRKQWEFAMIYLALKKQGMLDAGKTGLSMGSGKEVILYAIASKVKHLTATDLYSSGSQWDGAKAADPDEYIRMDKPIPVDDSKLSALHMDMRSLAFEDTTFDFAYSACAFEHIGTDTDFLRHLDEVYRVLKDGGTYVMTTEFTFASKTVPIKNNYLFSAEHLGRLLADSRFTPEQHFDARITEQSANFPLPGRVDDLSYLGDHHFAETLVSAGVIPHVQVLYGKHPFTSCLFVLTKEAGTRGSKGIVFDGLAESRAYLNACVKQYGAMIQADLDLYPFSFLRGRMSPWFAPHVLRAVPPVFDGTSAIFHTEYYWFGGGTRNIRISMTPRNGDPHDALFVEFRVHRFKTSDPAVMDCCYRHAVTLSSAGSFQHEIAIDTDDEYVYAVLAVLHQGSCLFSDIRVRVTAHPGAGGSAGRAMPMASLGRMPFLKRMRAAGSLLAPEWAKRIYRRAGNMRTS